MREILEKLKIMLLIFFSFHIIGWAISSFIAWEYLIFVPIESDGLQTIARVFIAINFGSSVVIGVCADVRRTS